MGEGEGGGRVQTKNKQDLLKNASLSRESVRTVRLAVLGNVVVDGFRVGTVAWWGAHQSLKSLREGTSIIWSDASRRGNVVRVRDLATVSWRHLLSHDSLLLVLQLLSLRLDRLLGWMNVDRVAEFIEDCSNPRSIRMSTD